MRASVGVPGALHWPAIGQRLDSKIKRRPALQHRGNTAKTPGSGPQSSSRVANFVIERGSHERPRHGKIVTTGSRFRAVSIRAKGAGTFPDASSFLVYMHIQISLSSALISAGEKWKMERAQIRGASLDVRRRVDPPPPPRPRRPVAKESSSGLGCQAASRPMTVCGTAR